MHPHSANRVSRSERGDDFIYGLDETVRFESPFLYLMLPVFIMLFYLIYTWLVYNRLPNFILYTIRGQTSSHLRLQGEAERG
jgi:hypothetical protein